MNKSFYKKNGYVILKNFFSIEEIEKIIEDAKNIFLKQFIKNRYTKKSNLHDVSETEFNNFMFKLFREDMETLSNCGKQVKHLISLHRLSINDKIISLLENYGLKCPVISTRPVLFFNHPKLAKQKVYHKVDAHQDWRSMQGSLNSVVIWTPLMDIDKNLGALQVLPGSHLLGLRTKNMENGFGMVDLNDKEKLELKSIQVKKGDALIFSSLLIHQSGDNITEKPRWSCHFRYNDLDDPSFIDRKYAHPYIYKPIESLITPNFPKISDLVINKL